MIKKTLFIALLFFCIPHDAGATNYYTDFSTTSCKGDGLATTSAFCSIDQFTEVARSSGDILFVRRNTSTTTGISDINVTSSGIINNPIIVSSDYDNLWGDFATSSQTYTATVGSTTLPSSASTTGIVANDWIFVAGDCSERISPTSANRCGFVYRVRSLTANAITLYTPYRGNQSGAGLSLRNMKASPIWNTTAGDFQFIFNNDSYWILQGLHLRGTDSQGNLGVDSSRAVVLRDMMFEGNGTSVANLSFLDDTFTLRAYKCFFINASTGGISSVSDSYGVIQVYDSYFDSQNAASSFGMSFGATGLVEANIENSIFVNNSSADIAVTNATPPGTALITCRNCYLGSTAPVGRGIDSMSGTVYFEDYQNTIGLNRVHSPLYGGEDYAKPYMFSTTSIVRAGGGAKSIEILPGASTTAIWEFNKIPLFEYPIYASSSVAKLYTMYFRATTTNFTANPTSIQLWIECEYWANGTNASSTRKTKKSTTTIDFAGSAAWQTMSLSCTPTQDGILYLRGWYAKPKESGKSNQFIIDGTPVIS